MENFQRLASGLNVKPLLEAISRQPKLWAENTFRQDTPGSPHKDTECIFLRWAKDISLRGVFHDVTTVDYPAWESLPEARSLVDQLVSLADAGALGRIMIAKLKPAGYIAPHADEGLYADHFERFHVCLESEPGNLFFCGNTTAGEYVHMQPGEAWWFNHKRRHEVANPSNAPRLHLIIDTVAPFFRRERDA